MTLRLPLALLLAAAVQPLAAAPPAATCGPRVTLKGERIPLKDALDQLGRQINRRFVGTALATTTRANQPYSFELANATVGEALEAIELVTGYRVQRTTRSTYSLDVSRSVIGRLGRPLGDFVVWLTLVRYSFSSYVYPGDTRLVSARAYLGPQFILESPSDPESLRIRGVSPPSGVAADGQELPAVTASSLAVEPNRRDPRRWVLSQFVEAPEPEVEELARVGFDVTFVAELKELRFGFDRLAAAASRVLTDGDYDVRLTQQREATPSAYLLSVSGPVPTGLGGRNPATALQDDTFLEGRLYDARSRPIYTDTTLESSAVTDGVWTSRWRCTALDPDLERVPERLEVSFYVPSGEGRTVRVEFDHVRLPPRAADQPVAR